MRFSGVRFSGRVRVLGLGSAMALVVGSSWGPCSWIRTPASMGRSPKW